MSQSGEFVVLGVDCGFSKTGVAAVRGPDLAVLDVGLCRTEKGKIKNVTVLKDDAARYHKIGEFLIDFAEEWDIDAISAEAFAPNPAQGGFSSGAWKTIGVYGQVLMLAIHRDIPFMPARPQELKREISGRVSASKSEVESDILNLFDDNSRIADLVDETAASSYHEHMYDAIGHGVIGVRKIMELRKQAVV